MMFPLQDYTVYLHHNQDYCFFQLKCYSHPVMTRYEKVLVFIGSIAGIFLLWLRLGGIAGIAETALHSFVQTAGTSPYAEREIAATALGIDTPARYLILFAGIETAGTYPYTILRVRHAIPFIEKQGHISTSVTTTEAIMRELSAHNRQVTALITIDPQAIGAFPTNRHGTISLIPMVIGMRQNFHNIRTLLDQHHISLFSPDGRLQKIFVTQGWTL